jgi:hypothetical protein
MDRRELGLSIADNGGWEEFHQKRGNHYMYDYHKNLRLKLEREYREKHQQIRTQKTGCPHYQT